MSFNKKIHFQIGVSIVREMNDQIIGHLFEFKLKTNQIRGTTLSGKSEVPLNPSDWTSLQDCVSDRKELWGREFKFELSHDYNQFEIKIKPKT